MKSADTIETSPGGYLAILVTATLLMGSSFPAIKILLHEVPPFYLAGWRFLLATAATLPIAWFVHRKKGWVPRVNESITFGWVVVALIGLFQTAGTVGLLNLAMQRIPSSTAAILLFTNPLWVALLGLIVLNEHLSRSRLLALTLGITGVIFAIGLRPGGTPFGIVAGLGSAACWAVATVLNKRFQVSVGIWALSAWQMLVGALTLLSLAVLTQESWPQTLTVGQWAWFVWLAIPASTGSFGLWFLALKHGGATHTSGFLFLVPLFAVLLSHLVLGERLVGGQLVGGVLVGASLWLLNRDPLKQHRANPNVS